MLTKPEYGWTDFSLEGTGVYGLSYLSDVPFEWLDQAIHGLETMLPFCVKGLLEPGRMLCAVSYCRCHILLEHEGREPMKKEDVLTELSNTSMLEFCKRLHADISACPEEWALFVDYGQEDPEEKRRLLRRKLDHLAALIAEKEVRFGEGRGFL